MDLFIIGGFLGSGKTTFLLSMAKAVSESGRKMAIIENEAGEIGVDGVVLQEEGLPVKEIYSGCICCSLRLDLISSLLEIERKFSPDVVLLEPSGMASPKQVLNALNGYGGEIENKRVVTLVDAERFSALDDLSLPIISDGLNAADIIIVNKIDLIDSTRLECLEKRILKLSPDVKVSFISALDEFALREVVDDFLAFEPLQKKPSENQAIHKIDEINSLKPSAVAYELDFSVREANAEKLSNSFANALKDITIELEREENSIVGHIKAIAKTSSGGYLLASSTSSARHPDIKGRLPRKFDSLKLSLNVVVYGIESKKVMAIAETHFSKDKFIL